MVGAGFLARSRRPLSLGFLSLAERGFVALARENSTLALSGSSNSRNRHHPFPLGCSTLIELSGRQRPVLRVDLRHQLEERVLVLAEEEAPADALA